METGLNESYTNKYSCIKDVGGWCSLTQLLMLKEHLALCGKLKLKIEHIKHETLFSLVSCKVNLFLVSTAMIRSRPKDYLVK